MRRRTKDGNPVLNSCIALSGLDNESILLCGFTSTKVDDSGHVFVAKCCLEALIETDEEAAMEVVLMWKRQEDGKMDCSVACVLVVDVVSLKRPLLKALGRKEAEVKEEEVDCSSACVRLFVTWWIPRRGIERCQKWRCGADSVLSRTRERFLPLIRMTNSQ